jgi:hypothetical protein
MPDVKPGDTIYFGSAQKAVICHVYNQNNVEAVYLDHKGQAINEDMVFENNEWDFKISGPCGGYADKNPRLSEFVRKLKNS